MASLDKFVMDGYLFSLSGHFLERKELELNATSKVGLR